MKKNILILFSILISLHCLKAKKSPFDATKSPSSLLTWFVIATGFGTSANNSFLPNVTSTSPADNDIGVTSNTQISITFNTTMDKSTITTNSDNTTCSGTVQISFDNFATCIKMRSSITTTDNKTFVFNPNPTMGTYSTHKIKVTTGATSDVKEKLSTDYSHTNGFTTATPCTVYNAQTCPIPFSTAATMTTALNNGGIVIPIESGLAKGKILVVIGNATLTTNVYNPDTGIFSAGPNLTGNHGPSSGESVGTAFTITSGSNSGKVLIVHGNLTNTTSIYDPILNTMQVGPLLTDNSVNWIQCYPIVNGSNAGKTLIVSSATSTTNIYDPATNTFSVGPAMLPATPAPGSSSHNVTISSGSNSGKTLVVYSGGSGNTSIYDPTANSFSSGTSLTPSPSFGSNSFIIPSGAQAGNILIARGNSSTNTLIFNTTNLTVSAGPSLPSLIDNPADVGTHSILISSGVNQGKIWLIHGANNPPSSSSFYDPNTNSFSVGPTMITRARLNSKTVYIESGIYAGKYMTFYGAAQYTSLYDPIKNGIDPSSILPSSAGNGINQIPITSGTNSGKLLILNGGNNTTSLFDFTSGTFTSGPTLTGTLGRNPGLISIASGTNSGKTLVVHGGNTTSTSIYDPATNAFSAGPTLSAASDSITNGCIFNVPSGTQAGKYLIVHGNTSMTSTLYDPSNNTMAAGPSAGSIVGLGATCFPIASGTHSGKFLVIQGALGGTGTRMYDPGTNSFAAGPALTVSATNGTFAMPINIGTNANKVLIFIGTGTTTNLYDPATHTFSAGPNLSTSAAGGGYLLLSVGSNKNKYLIFHSTTSSIYDPNTNTISSGPALPDGSSSAFNVSSGLYNQGVMIIAGGTGNLTTIVYP